MEQQITIHKSVLLEEVVKVLDPQKEQVVVDGTLGGGGYTEAIRKRLENTGTIIALDRDPKMLGYTREKLEEGTSKTTIIFRNENFKNLRELLKKEQQGKVNSVVLDLGFASDQLLAGRGFSFQKDEPLLMTYSDEEAPVKEKLQELSETQLAEIIASLSDERYAKQIAHAIVNAEKSITTTRELVEIIKQAVPKNYERGRINPATRTFLALRMYVNHELEDLEKLLKDIPVIVKPGGVVAIVTFQSTEDRIVKNYFREYKQKGIGDLITKKPISPSEREVRENPRARSAKLRAIRMN
ncbi:MAG: 16S rRNA (cytosine(1402)-N(4))-methyltransferase [Candidatus Harrisonbacteria bacterium CG10_big_fil_rev_8_21_14_0_10_42_17]|uniref:Ribosomal RNA small subunit methyltransferase H n=1 Tax=Candidatus Harrisonbacteria bacterium CG10_big_fil_rev_8_21_14_0_10_42_17 TaxID=1974584 RepID=A0A2M6WGW5_9BACT|nr:MAG: 16S rRNA (cytosine(1402)-N(4))-methyltransferase [Candidatus Harrisonbacteria bacterium CG10_big_fil_rev_8_21_14_0_10_42_17]